MSLYNMANGVNPATFFILPVLGKHPDQYPRFRDCFIGDGEHTQNKIVIYTRTGDYIGTENDYVNDVIRDTEGFNFSIHDENDSTYINWVFDIPEKWKEDVAKCIDGRISETSKEYQDLIISIYPKISEQLKSVFSG